MKLQYLPGLLLLAASAAQAYPRSDLPSIKFEHKDWELVCDNTRTCRAAGYQAEDASPPASLLLTRRAGPGQTVRAQVRLANAPDDRPLPPTVQMSVGGRNLGIVRIDRDSNTGTLSDAQVKALLPALARDGEVSWLASKTSWTVSSAGATAVLLKMDDFQGRVDTAGALVRKGNKPESTVLPALPAPVVRAAAVARDAGRPPRFDAQQQRGLLAELRKTLQPDECAALDKASPLALHRLSGDKLLVSHPCWQGAYNSGDAYWVIEARPPYSPVLVTSAGSGYADGVIESAQRGRGIGDCMRRAYWTWDGRSFSQTLDATTGMCREVAAGGAWDLPTLVAEVRRR